MSKWDDFTSEVETGSRGKSPGCSMGIYLARLDASKRAQVEGAFDREELTTASIAAALRNRGAEVTDYTVGRHRRRLCTCERKGK